MTFTVRQILRRILYALLMRNQNLYIQMDQYNGYQVSICVSFSGLPSPQVLFCRTTSSIFCAIKWGWIRLFVSARETGNVVLCFHTHVQSTILHLLLSPTAGGMFLYLRSGGNYTHQCDSPLKNTCILFRKMFFMCISLHCSQSNSLKFNPKYFSNSLLQVSNVQINFI